MLNKHTHKYNERYSQSKDLIKKFIPNTDQNQEKFIKQILKDAIPKNQESLKIDKDTWKKLVK
jgi:hypothetical protein